MTLVFPEWLLEMFPAWLLKWSHSSLAYDCFKLFWDQCFIRARAQACYTTKSQVWTSSGQQTTKRIDFFLGLNLKGGISRESQSGKTQVTLFPFSWSGSAQMATKIGDGWDRGICHEQQLECTEPHCACVQVRVRERERVCASVCERERERVRKSACACVCEGEWWLPLFKRK